MVSDFLAPRKCFATRIPELDQAADLLDRAANSILAGEAEPANLLVVQADMPAIREYYRRIAGPASREIHRFRDVPNSPPRITASEKSQMRTPDSTVERQVYERDGWRCRFCEVRVIAKKALMRISNELPQSAKWRGVNDSEKHSAFLALCVSLDHVVPHSRGGNNKIENLVTTCWPCQFGRNQWTIEEVGLHDPFRRPAIVDGWDGLTRLC